MYRSYRGGFCHERKSQAVNLLLNLSLQVFCFNHSGLGKCTMDELNVHLFFMQLPNAFLEAYRLGWRYR
jgi:hypothetical protein